MRINLILDIPLRIAHRPHQLTVHFDFTHFYAFFRSGRQAGFLVSCVGIAFLEADFDLTVVGGRCSKISLLLIVELGQELLQFGV